MGKFLRLVNGMPVSQSEAGGPPTFTYQIKTANYTASAGDFVQCTSGTFTVILQTAVGVDGQVIIVKNTGSGVITINFTGGEDADGYTTIDLSNAGEIIEFISEGTTWQIKSYKFRESRASFSNAGGSGTLSVASGNNVRINETPAIDGGTDITPSQDATNGCKLLFKYAGWATVTWGIDNFNGANLSYMVLNGTGRYESNYAGTVGSVLNSRGTMTIKFKVAANDYVQIRTTGSTVDTVSGVGHIFALLEKDL